MLPIIVDEGDRQIVIFGCVNHHGIKLSVGGIAGRNPHIPGDRNSLRADQQAPFRIFIRVAAMNQNKSLLSKNGFRMSHKVSNNTSH